MSSNGNGLANGKNGKNSKRRRRIIWAAIAVVVLGGGGYGVKAALSPSRTIDPSKIVSAERGDLARVVVATGKIPGDRYARVARSRPHPRAGHGMSPSMRQRDHARSDVGRRLGCDVDRTAFAFHTNQVATLR